MRAKKNKKKNATAKRGRRKTLNPNALLVYEAMKYRKPCDSLTNLPKKKGLDATVDNMIMLLKVRLD